MAVYDARSEQKLSETFFFDCNDDLPGFSRESDLDPVTLSREAVFHVDYPHDAVYLVVSFEKTLQGDVASVADLYCRGADKDKVAEKQAKQAAELHARLGKYRMPFMWAAVPAFTSESALNTSLEFSEFYRQDPDRLRNDEVPPVIPLTSMVTRAHTHIHTRARANTHVRAHTHARARTHTCTRAHTHTRTRAHTHTHTFTCTRTHARTR